MVEDIDKENLPSHIAVIMDGNGRWAKKKGAARIFGHQNAIKAVRETTEICAELGVKYLSLYAFSTENWGRPKEEIDGLMSLLVDTINKELPTLLKNNIRLISIGDLGALPQSAHKNMLEAIHQTKNNTGLNVVLALNYSGRWEITEATKAICRECADGKLSPDSITPHLFEQFLNTKGIPDPELLIRTSGELRISNFMLWQLAYTELFITEVLWPDFRKEDMLTAIKAYQQRERRFGKISEELN